MIDGHGVGLVGAGRIARFHVAALQQLGVPVRGLVASTPERSEQAARELDAQRSYENLSEMLRDPLIDAIHIATPTAMHASQVEQALRAGKHVICEKPLSTAVTQSFRLAQLAQELGLVGAVAYTYRFHPAVEALRAQIAADGEPILIHASYLQGWLRDTMKDEWRLDPLLNGPSRVLADIGSHAIDLIEHVTGDRMTSLCARVKIGILNPTTAPAMDDLVTVMFELEGGAVGTLELTQVAVGHVNTVRVEIEGDKGSAAIDLRDRTRIWHAQPHENPAYVPVNAMVASDCPTGTDSDYVRAYVAFIRDMRSAMVGKNSTMLPTFADCWRAHIVRDAILDATSRRCWVDIPPERASAVAPGPQRAGTHS